MGYLFLTLSLLCGVTKGYFGKRTSDKITYTSDAMTVNALRMLFCIFIGAIIVIVRNNASFFPGFNVIAISAMAGIATAVFAVSWLMCVRVGAYMMVDVFLLAGVIFPIVLCKIFFDEAIGIAQIIGIILLVLSGYIMCSYNVSIKGKMTPRAIALLLLCALSNGTVDFAQKLLTKTDSGDAAVFNLYTYVFAALTLAVCAVIFRKCERKHVALASPIQIIKPIVFYILIMAVCLFLNSYFKTLSANELTATQLYPLYEGGAVLLSLLMSVIFFKEKINTRCIIGVICSFVALILINLF